MRRPTLACATLSFALLAPALALAWQTAVSGTPFPGRPLALDVDGAGDVLAVGRIDAPGGNDGIVVKLAGSDGGERWQRTVAGSSGAADQLRAVTHDAAGAVIAAGQATNSATAGDALLVKYDAAGTPLWRLDFDGGAHGEDDAFAVAVDGTNVVVAGRTTPSLANARFSVLERAGTDGGPMWRTDLTGSPGTGRALVVSGGDVVAAGDVGGLIVVVKVAADDGTPAWRTDVAGDPTAADVGRAVAVGGGRIVVAGRMVTSAGGPDFAVVALDATTGAETWRYVVDGSAVGGADADDAFDVAVDAGGDVIAVGRISDAVSDDDLVVVKLAGTTGDELWRTTVKGGNDNDDDAQDVALDAAGDALVVGSIRNSGTGRDVLLGKFAGTTGVEQWRVQVDGTESAGDVGSAGTVSAAGDAVAAGRLRNGAGDAFVVLKRTGANGGDFPCANGQQDPGEACDDGNLAPGDGCRADCTAEVCGDGIRDPQEACDDGNLLGGDCCSAACAIESDGDPCDDGDACTSNGTCTAGQCVPASVVTCVPESCHTAACNPADGTCSSTPKPDGALCDDGNPCTTLDRCVDAVCAGADARSCEDGDPCTLDRCDPAVGCVSDPRRGFESVICVLERQRIRNACGPDVPRSVRAAIDRVGRLLARAADADRPRRVRRALARAIQVTKRGVRVTAKRLRQDRVSLPCAAGITDTLNDLVSRASVLRVDLAGS